MLTHIAHQPFNGVAGDAVPLTFRLATGLANAINSEVLGERACDFALECQVTFCPRRQAQWISSLHDMLAVSGSDLPPSEWSKICIRFSHDEPGPKSGPVIVRKTGSFCIRAG